MGFFDKIEQAPVVAGKSPGVARMEAITESFNLAFKCLFFVSIFLVSYAYGLDGMVRYIFQGYATASYSQHSLLATVQVLRSVIAAAAQPTTAKLMDVFGRAEVLVASILFYCLGTAIQAASTNVQTFCGGAVLYQIGYTIIMLLGQVLIGDSTALRNRVLFSFIPATPFLINTWISGDVIDAFVNNSTWQWGIGCWAIIFFFFGLLLLTVLIFCGMRAKRMGLLAGYKSPYHDMSWKALIVRLFWQLDTIGIILLIAVLALILTPFTIASYAAETWRSAHIIAMLVIGVCCIPALVFWETKAPHPLIPFKFMKDRGVWGGFLVAIFLNWSWYLQGNFLYPSLLIGFNESAKSATRIASLYSFASVLTGVATGFAIRYVKYIKPFCMSGVAVFFLAFGLLIRYRGGDGAHDGVVGAQVLLGIGGGLFAYPTQAAVQSCVNHEAMALVTALYLSSYNVGSALGFSVSGGIWSNVLPSKLAENLGPINATLAALVYEDPYTNALAYPWQSPERIAIVASYRYAQKILCTVGICLCIPLFIWTCLLRNHKVGDEQSRVADSGDSIHSTEGSVDEKKSIQPIN